MKTKEKLQKQTLFWGLSGITVILLLVLCLLPQGQPQPTEAGQTEYAKLIENPLKASDFVYEGEYLACLSAEAVLGIDVSVWQGQIDWEQVKAAGVRFVMIRLGYRSMHEGAVQADSCATANYAGAKAAGIAVGAYFFSQAVTVAEAVEEAEFALKTVRNWNLEMPIVYDWEHTGQDTRTANVDARTLTDCAKAFCRRVEDGGYEAMVYFNTYQAENSMYLEELAEYPFWLAQYDQMLEYPYRVDMWQYTSKGRVPGITGDVDLNLYFIYEAPSPLG